jgi:hypothetical protein
MRERSAKSRFSTGFPFNRYEPPVGVSSNPIIDNSVDFPQPDGPDIATYSPLETDRCTPLSAWVSTSSV